MKQKFKNYLQINEPNAGYNVSWGSIMAGVVTFIALFFTLSLVGSAIGFDQFNPTSNKPLDGVGTGLLVWTIFSLALSYLGAGFISGVTARRVGVVHGFLTWSSSVILMIFVLSYMTVGTFSAVGSLIGMTTSAIGDGAKTIGSITSDVVDKSFKSISSGMGEIDTDELEKNINDSLKETDIAELQPNYLKNQLSEATNDITFAGKELILTPDKSDDIMNQLSDDLQKRAQTIADSIDEEAIAREIAKNTELSKNEAEEATKNIVDGLQQASTETENQINKAQEGLEKAKDDIDKTIEEARNTADDVSNTTAKVSIWGFIVMVLGLLITSYGGVLGSNFVKETQYEDKI